MFKKIKLLGIFGVFATSVLQGQTENSPYSRYGLGDQLPAHNIMSRGMAGVSAAYADILTVNFTNPASYSKLKRATLDFGVEVDSRTLKVIDPPRKFNSVSPSISYLQLGLPLSQKRDWGMNIGLRPVTRINYSLERNERLEGVDSVRTQFEGNGGAYEVYTGTGFSIKNLSLGFNVGYMFGTKEYTSKRTFIPDSAGVSYLPSQYITNASFGGLFFNAGAQYTAKIGKKNMLRLGAYGNLKRTMNGTKADKVQTYRETETGIDSIDVIMNNTSTGDITYPSSIGFGFMFHGTDKWIVGADFSQTKWSDYTFFESKDSVSDSWKLQLGGQILPNFSNAKSYWGRVTYRAGFFVGNDYVRVGKDLPVWGVSLGLGLPMRPPAYSNQYSIINTSIEFGQRGNNTNVLKENFLRLSLGFTLSDIWFIKRKYD